MTPLERRISYLLIRHSLNTLLYLSHCQHERAAKYEGNQAEVCRAVSLSAPIAGCSSNPWPEIRHGR